MVLVPLLLKLYVGDTVIVTPVGKVVGLTDPVCWMDGEFDIVVVTVCFVVDDIDGVWVLVLLIEGDAVTVWVNLVERLNLIVREGFGVIVIVFELVKDPVCVTEVVDVLELLAEPVLVLLPDADFDCLALVVPLFDTVFCAVVEDVELIVGLCVLD